MKKLYVVFFTVIMIFSFAVLGVDIANFIVAKTGVSLNKLLEYILVALGDTGILSAFLGPNFLFILPYLIKGNFIADFFVCLISLVATISFACLNLYIVKRLKQKTALNFTLSYVTTFFISYLLMWEYINLSLLRTISMMALRGYDIITEIKIMSVVGFIVFLTLAFYFYWWNKVKKQSL